MSFPLTLAFGAHPDDIEFGFVVLPPPKREPNAGRTSLFVRAANLERMARQNNGSLKRKNPPGCPVRRLNSLNWPMMRTLKFAFPTPFDWQKSCVAPSPVENQHPDHACLGKLVRDAARLARFGGLRELLGQPPHAVKQLFFYAITPEAEAGEHYSRAH
jgi:N-acetylglucosamine malate deacetylase 1